jgi:hypothetical protein
MGPLVGGSALLWRFFFSIGLVPLQLPPHFRVLKGRTSFQVPMEWYN